MMPRNSKRRRCYARVKRRHRARRGMVRLHRRAAEPPLKHIAVFADVMQHARIRALRRRVKCRCKVRGKRRNILQMLEEKLPARMRVVRTVRKIAHRFIPFPLVI